MRLLLDSNIVVPVVREEHGKLGAQVNLLLNVASNDIFVSVASIWEIAIKTRLGKLLLKSPLQQLPDMIAAYEYTILAVDHRQRGHGFDRSTFHARSVRPNAACAVPSGRTVTRDHRRRALESSPRMAARMSALLLKPARVWSDGAAHEGWSVLVRGERIAAAGAGVDAGDAKTIDLAGLTLMPGLMDLHSHLFLHPYNEVAWDDQVLKESEAYRTVRAVRHAQAHFCARGLRRCAIWAPRARVTPTWRSSGRSTKA